MTAHSAAMRRSEIRNAEFGITHRGVNLCMARERPRLPLRREVARRIKD